MFSIAHDSNGRLKLFNNDMYIILKRIENSEANEIFVPLSSLVSNEDLGQVAQLHVGGELKGRVYQGTCRTQF